MGPCAKRCEKPPNPDNAKGVSSRTAYNEIPRSRYLPPVAAPDHQAPTEHAEHRALCRLYPFGWAMALPGNTWSILSNEV